VYNVSGRIGECQRGLLDGPVLYWVEEPTRLTLEYGIDTFIFWPSEDHERQIGIFAEEVVSAVREAVTRERYSQDTS
jgi:hypothetical protein